MKPMASGFLQEDLKMESSSLKGGIRQLEAELGAKNTVIESLKLNQQY